MSDKANKIDAELKRQRDLREQFFTWFEGGGSDGGGLKSIMERNRQRYRMILEDEADRLERGLSALPSTKSVSIVDNFCIDAVMEYHGEQDAISYTAKDSADTNKDNLAKWLTNIVQYRMDNTFTFTTWHLQSLKAGAVDGMEAVMVSWKKESYTEPKKQWLFNGVDGPKPISKEAYDIEVNTDPENVVEIETEEEVVVTDTWWLDQLKPGENLLWDFKNPILDLNSGEWCLVILYKTVNEILQLRDKGIFDSLAKGKKAEEILKEYQDVRQSDYIDNEGTTSDPDTIDTDEYNRVPVWLFFGKDGCQWKCSFSIDGHVQLAKERPVNDVFFAGRRVNRLPVVLGCSDFELWEPVGRGLPKLIGPLEDELIDAKNNANDYAKQIVQGRARIKPSADIDEDEVLNAKIFYAEPDDVEFMQQTPGFMESLRVSDTITADVAELAPMGMESKNFVPKGIAKTLGAAQMQQQSTDRKLSTRLLVRNETFFKPLLNLIAEMEFSFETDDTILRIAGTNAKMNPPTTVGQNNQQVIDLEQLDFPVDVKINAGLGNIPKQLKAQKIMQISDWRTAHGIPTDIQKIAQTLNVLAGFTAEQWDLKQPAQPDPPEVEFKLDVAVDYADLPPEIRKVLIQKAMTSQGAKVGAKVKRNEKAVKEREKLYGLDEQEDFDALQ